MGDFTRCHTYSFMKEASVSLQKPGEALASGEAYSRTGQWHPAQVLPDQVPPTPKAVGRSSETLGRPYLPQPWKTSVPSSRTLTRKHQALVFWGSEQDLPLTFPTPGLGHLALRSLPFCS